MLKSELILTAVVFLVVLPLAGRLFGLDSYVFVAVLVASLVLVFALPIWHIWKTERATMERFNARPRVADEQFLRDLGVEPTSPLAAKILAVRIEMARLGHVSPQSLRANDRIYVDLSELPFYDSIDFLGLVLTLEKELGIRTTRDDFEEESYENLTVGEFLSVGIRIYQKSAGTA